MLVCINLLILIKCKRQYKYEYLKRQNIENKYREFINRSIFAYLFISNKDKNLRISVAYLY